MKTIHMRFHTIQNVRQDKMGDYAWRPLPLQEDQSSFAFVQIMDMFAEQARIDRKSDDPLVLTSWAT